MPCAIELFAVTNHARRSLIEKRRQVAALQSAAREIIRGIRAIRGLSPIRSNYSTIQRFNDGEAIRVHSYVFVVNIRRWLRLTTGE